MKAAVPAGPDASDLTQFVILAAFWDGEKTESAVELSALDTTASRTCTTLALNIPQCWPNAVNHRATKQRAFW